MQLPNYKAELEQQASVLKVSETPKIHRTPFSQDGVINHLVKFIVANDQSINVIENPQFREMLSFFREEYHSEDLPHRTKIRAAIIEAWQSWFLTLKNDLKQAVGALAFTMDVWSNRSRQSFICITVHWLVYDKPETQEDLVLKSALLAFHPLYGSHSGARIAKVVYKLLERAGINGGDGAHWTLDMASNNESFIDSLGTLYEKQVDDSNTSNTPNTPKVTFDRQECRIMCFPHVINTCAQHTIKALNSGDELEDDSNSELDDDEDNNPNTTQPNLLSKVRLLVKGIRASGQRQQAFYKVIKAGNDLGWWRDGDKVKIIKPRKLLRDVRTRWDSTYQMLVRLLELRQPINQFLNVNNPDSRDLQKFRFSEAEWSSILHFVGVLQYPHAVQQVMSKEKTPVLAGAIPSLERFMTTWENLAKQQPHLAPALKVGLQFAYKYYNRMDTTKAYIIAMFLHPGIRMTWIKEHWDITFFSDAERKIKNVMEQYRKRNENPSETSTVTSQATSPKKARTSLGYVNLGLPSYFNSGDNDMNWADTSTEVQTVEQEYHAYGFGVRTKLDVNIFKFWETHKDEFPTIFAIALDYLSIQASAVPCERAFSSSAETDTVRRNRISPVLMEALQMLKFALRTDLFNFTEGFLTPEEDLVTQPDTFHDLLGKVTTSSTSDAREDAMDQILREIADPEDRSN